MELTNAYKEAVKEKSIRKIRIMLKDSLLVDPSFERFREMEKAASSVEGLYDEHDGRELIDDRNAWDDDYMDMIMVQVVGNFSHERVEHLKEVVRYLRPLPNKEADEARHERGGRAGSSTSENRRGRTEYQEQKYQDQMSGDYRNAKIAGGAVAGGLAGAGVGVIFSMSGMAMVGVVAVGALAGGATVIALAERK